VATHEILDQEGNVCQGHAHFFTLFAKDKKVVLQHWPQVVTGRNLPYGRALDIIQNEEYLSAVDTSIIRRNFYPEFRKNNYYFPDFQQNNFSDFDDNDRSSHRVLSRDQWYKTFFFVTDSKKNKLKHFLWKAFEAVSNG